MMSPKKTKYRKAHKGRIKGSAKGGFTLNFGEYGLKALEPERVTARQIEAARRAISRHVKRVGRLWIRIFPDVPVTRKPAEVRMGSGKGSVEFWVCRVKPGRILFEIDGVPEAVAREAFDRASGQAADQDEIRRAAEGRTLRMKTSQNYVPKGKEELKDMVARPEERAVQPAYAGDDRRAGKPQSLPRSAPHHRPRENACSKRRREAKEVKEAKSRPEKSAGKKAKKEKDKPCQNAY